MPSAQSNRALSGMQANQRTDRVPISAAVAATSNALTSHQPLTLAETVQLRPASPTTAAQRACASIVAEYDIRPRTASSAAAERRTCVCALLPTVPQIFQNPSAAVRHAASPTRYWVSILPHGTPIGLIDRRSGRRGGAPTPPDSRAPSSWRRLRAGRSGCGHRPDIVRRYHREENDGLRSGDGVLRTENCAGRRRSGENELFIVEVRVDAISTVYAAKTV